MMFCLCCPCRFSETFDGVVLAYDVNFLDKCAKILPGVHPYFGIKLKAKLLLFSPKPNMLLGNPLLRLISNGLYYLIVTWLCHCGRLKN